MSKRILNHNDHIAIINTLAKIGEAENSVCMRLAANFGCGKGRIYELRHGIHTPLCCQSVSGLMVVARKPIAIKGFSAAKVNLKPLAAAYIKPVINYAMPVVNTGNDQPIVGFRMWNYGKNDKGQPTLGSYNSHFGEWIPGQKYVATCANKSKHEIPSVVDCCGVHAYKEKTAADLLIRSGDGILGAVVMTGTVREHQDGYRAQYAKVLCFSVKPPFKNTGTDTRSLEQAEREDRRFVLRVKRTEALSLQYGVPIIPYEHIELYISEFGQVFKKTRGGRA